MTQQGDRMASPQGPGAPRATNGMAVAALVVGVIACLLFWTVIGGIVLGLLGLIFGIVGSRRAKGGRAPHRGMAIVGAVLGTLGLLASTVIIIAGVSLFNSEEFDDYRDCMKHANSQSDEEQCAKDFSRDAQD